MRDRELALCVVEAGLAASADEVAFESLGGGISNDVLAFSAGGREYVLKRALPKLRVAAEWHSDVRRIHREAACQRWLTQVLRPGEVPAVVAEDELHHVYIMERAPRDSLNWKDEMLAGRVHPQAAARAGDLLGRLHAAGAENDQLAARFGDQTVFDQLRLDPYLRTTAANHPALAEPIGDVIRSCAEERWTVVHGDYSPKNILLRETHLVLLDHEVVHYGDPRFDLGFFFTHLFLKALHLGLAELWEQIPRAWAAYRTAYPGIDERSWQPHLGCMLLARVDGKSPAGYLSAAEEERVRLLAEPLIRGQTAGLADALALAERV
ncbi:MAG: phosphotransferase [Armatimonadetes bacterium]|nr:phosphotransferase [Armatimonadota bacterium]